MPFTITDLFSTNDKNYLAHLVFYKCNNTFLLSGSFSETSFFHMALLPLVTLNPSKNLLETIKKVFFLNMHQN